MTKKELKKSIKKVKKFDKRHFCFKFFLFTIIIAWVNWPCKELTLLDPVCLPLEG